jgi:hypothetical protein
MMKSFLGGETLKNKQRAFLSILIGILIILAGCTDTSKEQKKPQLKSKTKFAVTEAKTFKIDQIRGIGYPGNDTKLYLATNDGLKMYKDQKWFETTTNQNDYIGFQAVKTGFIASGHPQKGTDLKNPLGIVQVGDYGKNLNKISFYGQEIFHFMAGSFSGVGLYVISEQENHGLSLGLNYSKNKGKSWNKSVFKGFNADSLGMIAVHPQNGSIIAMSTRSGIYYSEDNGNTMKPITAPFMVTALTFTGDSILFSSVENEKVWLKTINPQTGQQTNVAFPFLDYDNPITYLAVNPENENQIAFTTYKNDLYETVDGGKNWSLLLKDGKK